MNPNRKMLDALFSDDWHIIPAGGMTGEAYVAKNAEQSLFVKFNSSPLLAVLSVEGIVPKLVWTKRLPNGQVVSAQVWLEGRKLSPTEMGSVEVAQMLHKIHTSLDLRAYVDRMGILPLLPEDLLFILKQNQLNCSKESLVISDALSFLEETIADVTSDELTICHCDINHNNFIRSEHHLYLIDWDDAVIADVAIDLGPILFHYVPIEQWQTWLQSYGVTLDASLFHRLKWYATAQSLLSFLWYDEINEIEEKQYWEKMIAKGLRIAPSHVLV
ncbi:MAG: phosphotransferase [Bacilli bacterium]